MKWHIRPVAVAFLVVLTIVLASPDVAEAQEQRQI
jgi:hypothetical protein